MTTFKIDAQIDPSGAVTGAVTVQRQLQNLESQGRALRTLFSQIFVGVSTVGLVKEAIGLADSYQAVANRLKAVSEQGADTSRIQDELTASANRSRSSFLSTATLYTRLIQSSKELGRTQGELIAFTESLNKTIILSGATSKEAAQSTIQLSQGLASGALRGDELRSVLEGLPAVADVIARGLGVTRGELRKMGEQGKITGNAILDAFQRLGPEIEERFGRTIPTLGESFTVLGNQVGQFLDTVNDITGALPALSSVVLKFGEAVEFATGAASNFRKEVEDVEKEGTLAAVGASINNVNRELRDLESRQVISESAASRIEQLKQQLVELQGVAKSVTKGLTPQDIEAAAAAREFERKSIAEQKAALQSIRGPQEAYKLRTSALNDLLKEGKITTEEYAAAVNKASATLQRSFGADALKAFKDQLLNLREQNDVLRVKLTLGELAAQTLEAQQDLERKGSALTTEQKSALEKELNTHNELLAVEKARSEEKSKAKQKADENARAIEDLTRQLDVASAISVEEARLNQILLERPDLFAQVSERLDDLRLRALESSTQLGDGFERAFLKIKKEAEDLASVGEEVVGVFADNATDALTEFAQTGKLNFKEFATSILSDLARIIARLLIVQALNAAFGGGGSALPPPPIDGARAEGGPVTAGRSYLVGENGPELFTPKQSGNITANGETPVGGSAVNVQIVNVTDPDLVPEAIASGAADQAILNVLSRNRDAVKQIGAQ